MAYQDEIVQEFNQLYTESYTAWNSFYPEAENDLRFYLGSQWTDEELRKLHEEGRAQFINNMIKRNIDMVDGYQRQHRFVPVSIPREQNDQEVSDDVTKLLYYAFDTSNAYSMLSDAFSGANKTGMNLISIYRDYIDDFEDGELYLNREPYSSFILDPFFTKRDLSDCDYILRRKYLTPEKVMAVMPAHKRRLKEIARVDSGYKDDKFTWMTYQRQPNETPMLAVDEMYRRKYRKARYIVDMETGETQKWEGDKKRLDAFLEDFPQIEAITKTEKYIERSIMVNGIFIEAEMNPEGIDDFPFVLMLATFEPESNDWSKKVQSLIRPSIDPQRSYNRRLCQIDDIVESNINSGWIVEQGSVENPRSLYQSGQGKVIWKNRTDSPNPIERLQPAQIPPSFFEMQKIYNENISAIMGINDAAFGQTENAQESGLMMMLRQGAAITNLQKVFDNLREAQKELAYKMMKIMQTWSDKKLASILGKPPSPQLREKMLCKRDISIQEGLLTESQKQLYFRQLLELKQVTDVPSQGPITSSMLVQAAPIQDANKLLQEIKQNEQQAAQQAQQQQQIQMAQLESQLEYNKASSIDKLAMAEERKGRTFSNLSLARERVSEAEQNRSQAALDRAKTLSELAQLGDDRLIKLMQFANELQRQEVADREVMGQTVAKQQDQIQNEVEQATQQQQNPQQQQQQEQMRGQQNEI